MKISCLEKKAMHDSSWEIVTKLLFFLLIFQFSHSLWIKNSNFIKFTHITYTKTHEDKAVELNIIGWSWEFQWLGTHQLPSWKGAFHSKMYFLLNIGIFQPAMLVYQRVISIIDST